MLGPAYYPVLNGPESLVFTTGKWGSGGEYRGANPLIQLHTHDRQVSPAPQQIDRRIAGRSPLPTTWAGTGVLAPGK